MKKILHFLIISFFGFNIISCDTTTILLGAAGGGAAYWYKDDLTKWYDDFSKESASVADETDDTEETIADDDEITSFFVLPFPLLHLVPSSEVMTVPELPTATNVSFPYVTLPR